MKTIGEEGHSNINIAPSIEDNIEDNMEGSESRALLEDIDVVDSIHRTLDPLCQANDGDGCYLASTDHRKVVSQYFGRNKRCTQQLRDDLWLVWCRKHYQQRRYNLQQQGTWHLKKLEMIRTQIDIFQMRTAVESWNISLRRRERKGLDSENAAALIPAAEFPASTLWERFLVPHQGCNRTFAEVYNVLRVIEAEFQTPSFIAKANKDKDMPNVEFLPLFPEGTVMKPIDKSKARTLVPHVKAGTKTSKSHGVAHPTALTSTSSNAINTTPLTSSPPRKPKTPRPQPRPVITTDKPKKRRRLIAGLRPQPSTMKIEETAT